MGALRNNVSRINRRGDIFVPRVFALVYPIRAREFSSNAIYTNISPAAPPIDRACFDGFGPARLAWPPRYRLKISCGRCPLLRSAVSAGGENSPAIDSGNVNILAVTRISCEFGVYLRDSSLILCGGLSEVEGAH